MSEAQGEVRRLSAALERSDAYLRAIIDNAIDLVTIVEADGTTRDVSPSVRRVLGWEPAELVGRAALDLVHPDDVARIGALLSEAVDQSRSGALVTYRYRHKNGSWRQLESSGINLLSDPAVSAIVLTSHDVTDRLAVEGRYRSLFDNMAEGFAHCRMLHKDGLPVDFVYLEVNHAFARLTGLNDVVGKRVNELIPDFRTTNPEMLEFYDRVAATGTRDQCETWVPGLQRWFSISAYAAEPSHFIAVFDNITERKRIEQTLTQSETEYRTLVEHAPLGIGRSTPDGRFTRVNPALVAMLGYGSRDELLALDIERDVYVDPADRRERVAIGLRTREPVTFETLWKRKDGNRITVSVHAYPAEGPSQEIPHFASVVEDITEKRSLELQFQQAQKMEAVGRLAGGIAHDFNNLLTAIIGYSELVLQDLAPDDQKRADIEEVHAAANRAVGLTRQLLAFSRKQVVDMRVLDLNYVVRAMKKLLVRLISEDITLSIALSDAAGMVRGDPGQIEQVILNLAVNARDAMPRGGLLTIETANVEIDDTFARTHADMKAGSYVMLAVTDTGVGMTADVLAHLFEPFFTTKEEGRGTGLGLSTVYGIVKQCGGSIASYSEPGQGATFKMYLPRLPDAVEPSERPPVKEALTGGRERVLVAEDDGGVREVIWRVLSQQGYSLILAPDGPSALEISRAHPDTIDLLLTDLVMPGMDGTDLAAAMKAERPGTRILFMSGYTDDAVFRHGVLEAGVHYLQKPFTAEALARKVRAVLDGPA